MTATVRWSFWDLYLQRWRRGHRELIFCVLTFTTINYVSGTRRRTLYALRRKRGKSWLDLKTRTAVEPPHFLRLYIEYRVTVSILFRIDKIKIKQSNILYFIRKTILRCDCCIQKLSLEKDRFQMKCSWNFPVERYAWTCSRNT